MSIFDSANAEIDRIVKEIPDGKKGALQTTLTPDGVRLEVGTWILPNWSLGAFAEQDFKGGRDFGVKFGGSW